MSNPEELRQLVSQVSEPVLNQSLKTLQMVNDVTETPAGISVAIQLPTQAYPACEQLEALIRKQLESVSGGRPVDVAWSTKVRGKDSGGRIGLTVHNVIAVGSGKGGVGKSTVATALACGLHALGSNVGLMDADVYGPSIPHMLGIEGTPEPIRQTTEDGRTLARMAPLEVDGLKLMSMGFFVEQGQSVPWRGPMVHKALTQFLRDTTWGELDYLIIDLPPGTGDVSLTLAQQIGLAGAVIVCTPQQVALLDAIKAVDMYQKVNVPILGFVENMTGEIFGRGGAQKVAEELSLPFLGEVPIDAGIREHGDAGRMMDLMKADSPARTSLTTVCQNVAMEVVRNIADSPAAPTLEIL